MDPTVAPGEDFYRYAVGGWLARHEIPADRAEWSTFHQLRADVEKKLHKIVTQARRAGEDADEATRRVADFYAAGMSPRRRSLGAQPLRDMCAEFDRVTDAATLAQAVAQAHRYGIGALFSPSVGPDEKNTAREVACLYQGGLTLPDRAYYLDRGARYREVRAAYRRVAEAMDVHVPGAQTWSVAARRIERLLAQHSRERSAVRDVKKNYHKMRFGELVKLCPRFDWAAYFDACGVHAPRTVVVGQPEYFRALNRALRDVPIAAWRNYLRHRAVMTYAPETDEATAQTHFAFFGTVLGGAQKMRPRWQRVVQAMDAAIGESLGELFVRAHFSPVAQRRAQAMVREIMAAFERRIARLSWMDAATKRAARRKLRAITVKIGAPAKPQSYAGLEISAHDHFGNVVRGAAWHFADMMRRIGAPTDRTRWEMTAHTVNAYYHPLHNEIVFPAGILQPPFFHADYDAAMNYGGIGTVIAHEISHAFDDQGSHFDARGNMRDWWDATTRRRFRALTRRMIAQADAYHIMDDIRLNGKLTAGENIADLGGLMVAQDAYAHGKSARALARRGADDLTPLQRFFCAYALTEAGKMREDLQRLRALTDPHAPGRFRVNNPASNMDAWYAAFDIPRGAALYRAPRERLTIW